MKEEVILQDLAAHFGIIASYRDLSGVERPTSRETILALLHANGVDTHSRSSLADELRRQKQQIANRITNDEIIIDANASSTILISKPAEWSLSLEERSTANTQSIDLKGQAVTKLELPSLPIGIHTLHLHSGDQIQNVSIIVAPKRTPQLIEQTGRSRIWGVNTALYGLHSKTTEGLGTYRDLALASEAIAAHGADFLGINPVHAIGCADNETISPYSPTHRGFLNTSHIDLSGYPRTSTLHKNSATSLDYDAHRIAQRAALESAYQHFTKNASAANKEALAKFCKLGALPLQQFALYETLSETHGPDWRQWRSNLQNPDDEAVNAFAAHHDSRIKFHLWLQWLAEKQLSEASSRAKSAGMKCGLYLDLAVGSRRGGAETWCEKPCIAQDISIGAPPDHLSPAGQNWNLAGLAPARLKETQYGSFRTILAQSLRNAGILRIDHVLGLNRSFWIPDNGAAGGYIRQPFEALLAVIAIEASKTGTVIVGEDLGLVPEGFRKRLHERGLYSYSVLQYEKDETGKFRSPDKLHKDSLVCFSTHDTPTLHGYLKQRDIDWWRKLNWIDDKQEQKLRLERTTEARALMELDMEATALGESSIKAVPFNQFSATVHGALAASPVAMVSVQLDDAFGEIEAQNLPGTIDAHPNWQRRALVPIESFSRDIRLAQIAKVMLDVERSVKT